MSEKSKILPAVFAIPSVAICGAFLGAFVAARVIARPTDGWDQIAQALGGLMLGALGGLVLAIFLVLQGSPRLIWRTAAVATLVVLLVFGLGYATRTDRAVPESPAPAPTKHSAQTEPIPDS